MKDYSIEYSIEQINSEKTKEYFREVSSSYYNGNYRAAVVTLYSVVITDILIKLEALHEIYGDETAKKILDEVKKKQEGNPKGSEWEKDIINEVKKRTNLIDDVDHNRIQALRNDRHLCAHPVIDKDDKLYTPNKETVASHIRNMLESLFLKPPILSKEILGTILQDLADNKGLFKNEEDLNNYIKARYLNKLNPIIEVQIFRDLWRFVYRLDNEEAKKNRLINYKLLHFLYKRNPNLCNEKIQSEQDYFSNILDSEQTIKFLISFLSDHEYHYKYFRKDVHLLLEKHIEKDMALKTIAWFLSESYLMHLEEVKKMVNTNSKLQTIDCHKRGANQKLIKIGYTKGYFKEVTEFIIWRYSYAEYYDDAYYVFSNLVYPNLDKFTKDQIIALCDGANSKSKTNTYNRASAEEDHEKLKDYIQLKVDKAFDFSKYRNVFKSYITGAPFS